MLLQQRLQGFRPNQRHISRENQQAWTQTLRSRSRADITASPVPRCFACVTKVASRSDPTHCQHRRLDFFGLMTNHHIDLTWFQ